ncbi:MAG: hypothetical protein NTX97_14280 [Bacteroidetes bacterium]|nr:hypothetical protein [Bacteroidota bacterium]
MKKSVLMIALAFGVSSAFAQLSTRENDETVQKIGARPKAGDMAFVLGTTIGSDSGLVAKLFSGNSLKSGNLLTYKFYKTDDLVIRAGIRLKNQNTTYKGSKLDSTAYFFYSPYTTGTPPFQGISEFKSKSVNRMWEIVPGVEKHFLNSNLFDAYVGADLYLGFGGDKTIANYTYINGDKNWRTAKTNTTDIGLGFISGFNVFIAHLPISVGLEYGWNAKWTFGGVTKVHEEVKAGSASYTVDYKEDNSTTGLADGAAKYSKLKKREFNAESNQDVRIVLHIYFGK